MNLLAAALALLLAVPAPDPLVKREIDAFVGNLQSARLAEAYAQMTDDARKAFGRAQFDAYVASRRRALGAIAGVENIRPSEIVEAEHGMTIYEADVRFEKGTSPAWFVLSHPEAGWRVVKFGLNLPAGVAAAPDPAEILPVVNEMMSVVKSDGLLAIAGRFSEKDLAAVKQTPEMVRAAMEMTAAILGPLESYTVGAPEADSEAGCNVVRGQGTFRYGPAPLQIRLCWSDGVWRLVHAQITPQIDPVVLERSIAYALKGRVTAKCPHGAALPVGGQIVCRLTAEGEADRDATILRTEESAWKIVALAPVKK